MEYITRNINIYQNTVTYIKIYWDILDQDWILWKICNGIWVWAPCMGPWDPWPNIWVWAPCMGPWDPWAFKKV